MDGLKLSNTNIFYNLHLPLILNNAPSSLKQFNLHLYQTINEVYYFTSFFPSILNHFSILNHDLGQ